MHSGKAKTVQQTTVGAGAAHALDTSVADDGRRRLGSGGDGQLSRSLTRATNTGLVHLAVARATLKTKLGGRGLDAPSAGKSSKLSGS